ncbi:MAG: hypothetical protein AAGJ28_01365 [Pseudomonadota bacterium]
MFDLQTIADATACGVRDWMALWGDPLISGTVFMLAYLGATLLILRGARYTAGRERSLWRICGLLFLFQVANTHLDAHALIFTTGRCLAHAQGWYENRRMVQTIAAIGLAVTLGTILIWIAIRFFRSILRNVVMVLGVSIALGFTVLKGINLHGLEAYYAGAYGPFRGADLIELSGIAIAALGSLVRRTGAGIASGPSGISRP